MLKRLMQRLKRWWSKPPPPPATTKPVATPAIVPKAPDSLTLEGDKAVIRREPVLDRQQRIAGYALSLRHALARHSKDAGEATRHLHDLMLISHLQVLDLNALLGRRLAFLALDARELGDPGIATLPARQCVILLHLSDGILPQALATLVEAYRRLGMRFGISLRQYAHPLAAAVEPFLDYAVLAPDDPLTWTVDIADWLSRQSHIRLLASGVDSEEAFLSAFRSMLFGSQVELFHGQFITRRETWPERPIEPGRAQIIELMNQLQMDADNDSLAQSLKRDSVLLYRLLRLANSPALRTGQPLTSAEEAVVLLGRAQLFRWLTLLLFQMGGESLRDLSLLDMALIRARFMETIAGPAANPAEAGQRFLVGLFSLLDVLLQCPLPKALALLNLPQPVTDALLHQRGPHAAYLELAQLLEGDELDPLSGVDDNRRLNSLLMQTGLRPLDVDACHFAALMWAESLQQ